MLGDFGRQYLGQRGAEVSAAHHIPFSARQRQSQQADHRAVPGTRTGSSDEGQARPNTIRCLVHAGAIGIATAITRVAPLSATISMRFNRFSLNCVITPGDARMRSESLKLRT